MTRLDAAILAVLFAPALALAQHGHHGGGMAKEPAPTAASAGATSGGPTSSDSSSGSPSLAAGGEDAEAAQGFHMGVDLEHSVGNGTFVDARYYASLNGSLGLGPSYSFKARDFKLNASARASFSWEYTLPDNDTGRRVSYSDIRLGLAAPGIFKEKITGIGASVNVGLSVPISFESRMASTITQASLGLGFSRGFFEKLDVGYRVGVSHGFFGTGQKLISDTGARDSLGNLIYVCRTDEQYCGTFGNNTNWSLNNSLSLGYRPTDKLSLSVAFGLTKSWKYAVTEAVDEYTPKAVDSNGNPVARAGAGQADSMSGSLGISYSLNDSMGLSLGMGTAGPPRTKDNKNFRFPFFDFIGPADSMTQYSLGFSAQL